MAFTSSQEENIAAYGGYGGGMGGSWCIIIVFFVIAWLLFRDGHRDGVDGFRGHGFGDGCGPCVRPSFIDESNYEEERNINAKLCKIEMEQQACCCKELEATHCEGEKTRALIEQNYIQDLRDKIAEQNSKIQTMKGEAFTERKIDQVLAAIGCTNNRIEKLECEVPKRPPVWCEGITPDTHHTDCDHRRDFDFPRRGRCDGFGFDGCCA